nr:DUF1572 domain-containing protein [Aestuariibaculum sediminum]
MYWQSHECDISISIIVKHITG